MFEKNHLVSTGFWYYDGQIKTGVAVEKSSTVYGTGDYEDDQDIQNDKLQDNYYIWFSTAGTEDFKNRAGYELGIEEAKTEAERLVGQRIVWTDL